MALVAYCNSSGDESDSEEEPNASSINKVENPDSPIENKDCNDTIEPAGLFSLLPEPKRPHIENETEEIQDSPIAGPKKLKPPVKITIPSLKQFENDEDEHKKKKFKPSDMGSGLLGMLPKPSNISIKEAGRKLTPHIFTRKVEKIVTKKKTVTKPAIEQSTSDDEEITDFFSLSTIDTPTQLDINQTTVLPISAETVLPNTVLNVTPEVPINTSSPWIILRQEQASALNTSSTDLGGTSTESSAHLEPQSSSSLGEDLLNDERFFRLQGKKARKKEEINFIDINGSDQMPKPEEWLKSISTEQSHRPMHKKGSMPSSQQRRKHQITYLAFQAKERELELKNQWAMNRLTRQQTQSKYGF